MRNYPLYIVCEPKIKLKKRCLFFTVFNLKKINFDGLDLLKESHSSLLSPVCCSGWEIVTK